LQKRPGQAQIVGIDDITAALRAGSYDGCLLGGWADRGSRNLVRVSSNRTTLGD